MEPWTYVAIRRQWKALSASINNLKRKYPNSEIIYKRLYIPNGVNLYNRLKGLKIIISTNNKFCIKSGSEAEMTSALDNICGDNN